MRNFEKNLNTKFGNIFLEIFPKENHRERVHEILSSVAGFDVGPLVTREAQAPYFLKSPFFANWTHSGDVCILAYSKNCHVGIDAEFLRKRSLKIASRFFHPEESACLNSLNDAEALEKFFKLWCRKEAYFKCRGGSFFRDALRVSMLYRLPENVCLHEWEIFIRERKLFLALAFYR